MPVIKSIRKKFASYLVRNGMFPAATDKRVAIVMYHGIDRVQDTRFNPRFFSAANFERQIVAFKKHFHILTCADFIHSNFAPGRPNMLITFDDGYANNCRYALPVLDKHGVHACFFITGVGSLDRKILWADAVDIVAVYGKEGSKVTLDGRYFVLQQGKFVNREMGKDLKKYIKESANPAYTEKQSLIDQLLSLYDFTKDDALTDYWQLMTGEEIRKTAQSKNITIGSHGFYHNNLGSLSAGDAVAESLHSKTYLQDIIQQEVNTIAFPDGSYTEQLNDVLYKEGFAGQFLVEYKFHDEQKRSFVHDRIGLYPFMGNHNEILYKILKD